MTINRQKIEQALALPHFDSLAAQRQMAPISRPLRRAAERPGRVRVGCVLALFYCRGRELMLTLTRRRDDLATHPGQISFPGGRLEDGESPWEAALRETEEEIGVPPADIERLGSLSTLYIPPSDFEVHPFVGWYRPGKRPSFRPQPSEVAEILEVSLAHLLDPAVRQEELWQLRGHDVTVPFFNVDGHKVWGATAMMLSELLARLDAVCA